MSNAYDALVIGGGHNGLVSAAYLARSGARTLVLESRNTPGGAATTEAPWEDAPHLRVTRLSYVMSLMPPTIIADLELERHGYKVHPMGPYYQAFPEGGSLTIYEDDPTRTYEQLAKWSKKDADTWPKWNAWLEGIADVMGPLLMQVPPNIGSRTPARSARPAPSWRGASAGMTTRMIGDVTRLLTMSIADLLDDWFESPQIKGALAVNGVIGTWAGPCEPGTAYVMAHHSIGDVGDGQLGSWGFPEGGMGGVSEAIARLAPAASAPRSAPTPGCRRCWFATVGCTARCWRTATRSTRPLVVTTLHPKTAFLDHIPRAELPDDFVTDIEHWKTRSGVVKINLALARAAELHRRPRARAGRAPHRLGRDGADHGVHRGRLPGRPRGQARGCCRSATASSRPRWTRR